MLVANDVRSEGVHERHQKTNPDKQNPGKQEPYIVRNWHPPPEHPATSAEDAWLEAKILVDDKLYKSGRSSGNDTATVSGTVP